MVQNNVNDVEKIRSSWKAKEVDEKASVDFWNLFAETQKEFKVPTFEDNAFLKLLKDNNMLYPQGKALDVGCGTGKYSFALSKSFKYLLGVDFSDDMLNLAREKSAQLDIDNVDFQCCKWQDFDIEKAGFYKEFDLVFAHMTPAINNACTLEKMIKASKGHCALSKPTQRVDSVTDKIMEYIGAKEYNTNSDSQVNNALMLLKGLGYEPQIASEEQVWESKKETKLATKMHLNRAKQFVNISKEDESDLIKFIKTFENDGYIYEKTNTTISTIYWKV